MADNTQSLRVATLEDYLNALKRHKLVALSVVLLCLLAAVLYTNSRTDQYSADARIVVDPLPTQDPNARVPLEREIEVVLSDEYVEQVAATLGVPAATVAEITSARFQPDSDVIRVEATAEDPRLAADSVNELAAVYVADRLGRQDDFFASQQQVLQQQFDEVEAEVTAANEQVALLDTQLRALYEQPSSPERNLTIDTLIQDRNEAGRVLGDLQNRSREIERNLEQLAVDQAADPPSASLLRTATPAGAPDGLPDSVFWIVAIVVGVILGIAAAFLRSRLDTSVVAAGEVEHVTGAPVLGSIPKFGWRLRNLDQPVMLIENANHRGQLLKESFRRLRSSTMFALQTRHGRALVVTSYVPAEGKSTIALNLALAAAQTGDRVVLISGDLRRPTIEHNLRLRNTQGISTWDGEDPSAAVHLGVDGVPSLYVLPAGPMHPSPGEFFASDDFKRLLGYWSQHADLVVIDSPPLDAAADAATTGAVADGVIVVVDASSTDTTDLEHVRQELQRAGAPIVGVVLNRMRERERSWLRRSRSYYYHSAGGG